VQRVFRVHRGRSAMRMRRVRSTGLLGHETPSPMPAYGKVGFNQRGAQAARRQITVRV